MNSPSGALSRLEPLGFGEWTEGGTGDKKDSILPTFPPEKSKHRGGNLRIPHHICWAAREVLPFIRIKAVFVETLELSPFLQLKETY